MSDNSDLTDDIQVEEESQYETLLFSKSPLASRLELAVNDIKDFIRKKGLIITGGTAIDFALRLKGDKIYSDESLVFPDLDFYSPNHAEDAYEIADILYQKGYGLDKTSFEDLFISGANVEIVDHTRVPDGTVEERREELEAKEEKQVYDIYAHIAMHTTTMRVKLHSYVVADVTYVPINIFDKLPFIMYDGMKIIHPHWQFMNMHHALAFPLMNPPYEVLFHRMTKDVERFTKLASYYPLPYTQTGYNVTKIDINDYANDGVLYGFAAYAVIYNIYSKLAPHLLDGIPSLSIDDKTFTSPLPQADYIVTKKPDNLPSSFDRYNPYMDYTLTIYKEKASDLETNLHILDCDLIPIEYRTIAGRRFTISTVQSLLMFMLLGYHTSQHKEVYAYFYNGLLKILDGINHLVERLAKDESNREKLNAVVLSSPFYISTKLFGEKNLSESAEVVLLRISRDIRKLAGLPAGPFPYTPLNYYPDRKYPHPEFDYSISKYFSVDGEKHLDVPIELVKRAEGIGAETNNE